MRNVAIGTGVLGVIVIACWFGTRGPGFNVSGEGFIACGPVICPAATAAPAEVQNAGAANPKGIANPPAQRAAHPVTGVPPILGSLLSPSSNAPSPATRTATPAPTPDKSPTAKPTTAKPATTPAKPASTGARTTPPATTPPTSPSPTVPASTPAPSPSGTS